MKRLGVIIFLVLVITSSSKADLIYDYCDYCKDSVICHTEGIVHQDNYLLLGLSLDNKELVNFYYQDIMGHLFNIKEFISKDNITYNQVSMFVKLSISVVNRDHDLLIPSDNLSLLLSTKKIVDLDRIIMVRHINYVIDILKDNVVLVKRFNL